ncbi:hypothetical protein [Sphingobium sp. CCH11-B1]|jgi:hypothetical protein|uniref:hypothetical protein n=1 Tax=Sphingobium sp. CCH11-B1 TaxID=1768781 RepID=UPI0008325BC5|nr:hypothetical protein [Sphingobium sp. CCH11-B1]
MKEQFNRHNPVEMRNASADRRAKMAAIEHRANEVGRKVEQHYQKHREQWTSNEYKVVLLKKYGNALDFTPTGAQRRNLMNEASINVARRHSVRHARVKLAQRNLIRDTQRDQGHER